MSGICYLVGTPIGNLKDITYRAVETLNAVDLIASEDTRHTRILLDRYEIKKPLLSYRKQNEKETAEKIASMLLEGKSVALVTDAGMPAISDPGAVLVRYLREQGLNVTVVPGPTAVASAISLAGLTENGFVFLGFLPEKQKEKRAILGSVKNLTIPLVFYCAPHDLDDTVQFLLSELGDRELTSVKELTKVFETVYQGTLSKPNIDNQKGEFVLIVGGAQIENNADSVKDDLIRLIESGMSKSEAVKKIAAERNINKNELYKISLEL